jgi:uncharacterized protein
MHALSLSLSLSLGLTLVVQGAIPSLTGRVVDGAGLLSTAERAELTRRLEAIEKETSVQIVVATIPSLEGEPIEDYSIRLADAWKAGQKGLDNGVILLVARDDRKVRIEVGYGLEAVIPDGLAGRIIRERIAPAFGSGNYYAGLLAGVEALDLAARKEYPEAPATTASRSSPGVDFGTLLFAYFIVGIVGNAVGVLAGILAGAVVFPLIGGSLAQLAGWWSVPLGGLFGLFAVLFLRGFGRRGAWTSPGPGGGYRGGGWGGGGFGGGGFGGGGGGFRGGGGGFGGGGASGSW